VPAKQSALKFMNEPPPIYGATANAWSDALDAEKRERENNFAYFVFGFGVLFAVAAYLYPSFAKSSVTVTDWRCPPYGVLKNQIEPLDKTWISESRRHGRVSRRPIDCRSFSPKTEVEAAKSVIFSNQFSLIVLAGGMLFTSVMLRFRLFLPGSLKYRLGQHVQSIDWETD
jgi:hypothetical protein